MLKENYDTIMRLNKQSADCVRNVEEALEKVSQSLLNSSAFLRFRLLPGTPIKKMASLVLGVKVMSALKVLYKS